MSKNNDIKYNTHSAGSGNEIDLFYEDRKRKWVILIKHNSSNFFFTGFVPQKESVSSSFRDAYICNSVRDAEKKLEEVKMIYKHFSCECSIRPVDIHVVLTNVEENRDFFDEKDCKHL